MAGFLDRNTRILDMVLTSHGKRLFSEGDLHFCYWIPFDDEIDYNPFISNSASLSADQLSASIYQSIETTPLREATTGYSGFNISGSDFTNVHNPIFTMAQGHEVLPRAAFPSNTGRVVETKQRGVEMIYQTSDSSGKYINPLSSRDMGVERFDSSTVILEFSYAKDSFQNDFRPEGFFFRVLQSGSSGWTEVSPRRDLSNDLCYNNDVRIFVVPGGA